MAENRTTPLDFSLTDENQDERQDCALAMSSQQPKKILKDKQNDMNKTIVPIKQYSNKFLRASKSKSKPQPPCRKLNTQQRFNVILKKKNVFNLNILKENTSRLEENWDAQPAQPQKQAMMKVSSLCKPRRDTHVKTETSILKENPQGNSAYFELIDSSLYNLLAPTSNLLNSSKSRFFEDNRKEARRKRNKSISIHLDKKQKISQSRGLQLYSKIFVRSKDEIVEKIKRYNNPREIPKYQNKQNFETRKITPIQKSRKAKILIQTYRPKKKSIKKYYTIQNCQENDEPFELSGWQTAY